MAKLAKVFDLTGLGSTPKVLTPEEITIQVVSDPAKFNAGAMENASLNIFNVNAMFGAGDEEQVVATPEPEPEFSIETLTPVKAMSPLRYRRNSFLRF